MGALVDFEVDFQTTPAIEPPRIAIGPRSHLSDRFVPDFELGIVPARERVSATVSIRAEATPKASPSYMGRKQKLLSFGKSGITLPSDRYVFDLRSFWTLNWSHAMNMCFPLSCGISDELEKRGMVRPLLVVNEGLSHKVQGFFTTMGFELLETNQVVTAPFVRFDYREVGAINNFVRRFLETRLDHIHDHVMANSEDLGPKLFLNRKDSRALSNNDEVTALLEGKGFRTIFAEEWSLEQQMRNVMTAKEIVAIHGAALWPMMYRRLQDGELIFTEMFNPGHVIPCFNHLTEFFPCKYIEVRGALNADMVPAIYNTTPNDPAFTDAHSLSSFRVDPESLELALSPERVKAMVGGVTNVWPVGGLG